jgi:hypothetical protein
MKERIVSESFQWLTLLIRNRHLLVCIY